MKTDLLSSVWAQPDARPELTPLEWETVLGQARRGGLMGRLAQLHVDQDWLALVAPGPRHYLESALRRVNRQRFEVQWELDCIRRALESLGCRVVLLKGAAYFTADLPPRRGRLFSDIDIMVERVHLPEVEGALLRAGYFSVERDAYNDRYYRQWMHEIPPLAHVHRSTVIDVHHTITPPTSRFKVDAAKLFERIERIEPIAGREGSQSSQSIGPSGSFYILDPQDMVLHSAVHLFQEGEFAHGLRDLLDLNDLLLHFGRDAGFWPSLFARAAEIGLGEPLFHALHHVGRLFGTRVPPELIMAKHSISPSWATRTAMSALLGLALRPDHPSCDVRFSKLARSLLYIRSHYLRMPPRLAIPHILRKAYMQRFPKLEVTPGH